MGGRFIYLYIVDGSFFFSISLLRKIFVSFVDTHKRTAPSFNKKYCSEEQEREKESKKEIVW